MMQLKFLKRDLIINKSCLVDPRIAIVENIAIDESIITYLGSVTKKKVLSN